MRVVVVGRAPVLVEGIFCLLLRFVPERLGSEEVGAVLVEVGMSTDIPHVWLVGDNAAIRWIHKFLVLLIVVDVVGVQNST